MKYFMGISILALLAGIRADDFQDLFLNEVASDEATNRHPLVVSNSIPLNRRLEKKQNSFQGRFKLHAISLATC